MLITNTNVIDEVVIHNTEQRAEAVLKEMFDEKVKVLHMARYDSEQEAIIEYTEVWFGSYPNDRLVRTVILSINHL